MDQLTNFLTPEQRSAIESSQQHINDTKNSNLRALPPDSQTSSELDTRLSGLDTSALGPSALLDMFRESVREGSKPRYPPPEVLPCANVETEKYRACPNPGKMACSSCRLVSYCSKVNIYLHYSVFEFVSFSPRNVNLYTGAPINTVRTYLKQPHIYHLLNRLLDCRNILRSAEWKPAWVAESRNPRFVNDMTPEEAFKADMKDRLSTGLSLYVSTLYGMKSKIYLIDGVTRPRWTLSTCPRTKGTQKRTFQ
jgi:hypothetical protein